MLENTRQNCVAPRLCSASTHVSKRLLLLQLEGIMHTKHLDLLANSTAVHQDLAVQSETHVAMVWMIS